MIPKVENPTRIPTGKLVEIPHISLAINFTCRVRGGREEGVREREGRERDGEKRVKMVVEIFIKQPPTPPKLLKVPFTS